MGITGGHRRDAAQGKTCRGTAVADHFPLALQHMNGHGGLAVFKGGKFRARAAGMVVLRGMTFPPGRP